MMNEFDDEYITDDNDPTSVEKIIEEDYTIPLDEEKIEFDEVFEKVSSTISDFVEHDKKSTQKILESLIKGEFRK